METIDRIEQGKATMRGLIHSIGIAKAAVAFADTYGAPGNIEDHAVIAGMVLAAYEAGQLNALQVHKETLESF